MPQQNHFRVIQRSNLPMRAKGAGSYNGREFLARRHCLESGLDTVGSLAWHHLFGRWRDPTTTRNMAGKQRRKVCR